MNTSSGVQYFWFQASKKTISCKFINRKRAAFLLNTIQPQQISTKIYFLVVILALYLLLSEVQKKKPTKISFSHTHFVFVKGWQALEGSFVQFLLMTLIQILGSHCLLWQVLNRQIKKEDLRKLATSFLLMQKEVSKYNRFTFNYTQQLNKYLSNKEDIVAVKKRFQELLSTQLLDKPQISPFLSQTFHTKFSYSNSQTAVAKTQLPPARQPGVQVYWGLQIFCYVFGIYHDEGVKKKLCPFCVHPKFLVLFKTLPGC